MEKIELDNRPESSLSGEQAWSGFGMLASDIVRLLRQRVQEHFIGTRLTLIRARVLVFVARFESIRQTDLAQLLEMQLVPLVKLVNQLVDENLVVRKPDPVDRRATRLYISSAAEPLLREIKSVLEGVERLALQGLSSDERKLASEILSKVRHNLTN